MTNQNNAAQAAEPQTVLSFDERERILCQFMREPINHDREMAIAIESAALSKLRAPVADERDRNATISKVVGMCNRIPGATTWNAAEFMYDEMHRRAALAVAGERSAVAYLDLGAGGYMDVGTDLTDEQLAALPKGRHMLAIIGTHGVNGYTPASAPVADERTQHDNWYSRTHMHEYSRDATWRGWQARAAMASAPVAPQACPTDVCQAGKADGVLCANDECDRASGVRPASALVGGEAQRLVGYYTDWAGERRYAQEPHEIDEPGLKLTFTPDNPASDYWHPCYAAPQASECECARRSKAVADSEAKL